MIFTILLNGSLGFGMLIAVSFCIGNIDDALNTPTGFPFIEIFAQATRSITGSTIMTSIIIVLVISATIGLLAASSRVMWAFARDNGLPGSTYLARVSQPILPYVGTRELTSWLAQQVEPRTQLPLYAIGLTTIISLLLALINIASTAAFNAIISLVVAGFLTSYLTPIILILHKRLGGGKVAFGPWKLGSRFGAVVNVVAIVYIIIAMFFSFWPGTAVVTPANMNWSILLFGVVMMFSMVFYLVHGRKSYKGPVVEVWE